jgi:hypothetical protein
MISGRKRQQEESGTMEKPATAHTIAIVWNRDLLFGSRIRGALGAAGLRPRFVATVDRFTEALDSLGDEAAIAIIDMNDPVPWDAVGDVLAARPTAPPTLGFGPHTDAAARRAAKAAGLTRVVSNGQFHRDMTALIERYRRH